MNVAVAHGDARGVLRSDKRTCSLAVDVVFDGIVQGNINGWQRHLLALVFVPRYFRENSVARRKV